MIVPCDVIVARVKTRHARREIDLFAIYLKERGGRARDRGSETYGCLSAATRNETRAVEEAAIIVWTGACDGEKRSRHNCRHRSLLSNALKTRRVISSYKVGRR